MWVKSLNMLLNESHWCITFKSQGEGESVILVNFIMQGDQITFQEQPAKHERLPEHNEQRLWTEKHHLLAPEIFTK